MSRFRPCSADGTAMRYSAIGRSRKYAGANVGEVLYRAEGYRRFQLKVGSDCSTDIARIRAVVDGLQAGEVVVADANAGWLSHEAARVVYAIRDLDLYVEQPCLTFQENLEVRRRTHHPFILDESIDTIAALLDAHAARAMDAINIKISKYGGLTLARQVPRSFVAMGISKNLERIAVAATS